MSELAAVEETAVWLEVNGRPAVTWMCTPELLEELAVGWLHGEGYIDRVEEVQLRPCATDLGFWAQVPPEPWAHPPCSRRSRQCCAPGQRGSAPRFPNSRSRCRW